MMQLHEKYGDRAAEILMANCRIWIYMNSRDITFLERLSVFMGDVKTRYTGEKERLVGISELQHLDDGEVIVLNDRCYPMRGYLRDYSEYCHFYETEEKVVVEENNVGLVSVRCSIDLMEVWYQRRLISEDKEECYEDEMDDEEEKGDYSEYMKDLIAQYEKCMPLVEEYLKEKKGEDENIPF